MQNRTYTCLGMTVTLDPMAAIIFTKKHLKAQTFQKIYKKSFMT